MPHPVVHFEIAGQDGAKLSDFYAKLFDWSLQTWEGADYHMISAQAPQNAIGGGIGGIPPGMTNYVTIYVQTDDLQASLDKATALGGKVVMTPREISPEIGSMAMFADPAGNTIGLFKPSPRA